MPAPDLTDASLPHAVPPRPDLPQTDLPRTGVPRTGVPHAGLRTGLLRARRGVAALEFGMVGVALCFLLTFGLELFWQVYAAVELDYGVREATRFSITGAASSTGTGSPTCRSATILWLVTYTTTLAASQLTVSSSTYAAGSSTLASGTTGGAAGQTQTYLFTYKQYFFTPLATALYGQAYIAHQAVAIIKNEAYVGTPC